MERRGGKPEAMLRLSIGGKVKARLDLALPFFPRQGV